MIKIKQLKNLLKFAQLNPKGPNLTVISKLKNELGKAYKEEEIYWK